MAVSPALEDEPVAFAVDLEARASDGLCAERARQDRPELLATDRQRSAATKLDDGRAASFVAPGDPDLRQLLAEAGSCIVVQGG